MNWKFFSGKILHDAEQRFIKINSKFIKQHFPYGRDWMFDVKRILKDAAVIIDAGANIGSISKELHFWFPDAQVYAFEPVSSTFNALKANTGRVKNIHPVPLALGDKQTTINIQLSSEHTINSLKLTAKPENGQQTETITATRLDTFLQQQGIQHIDILKIDVEGYEFEVLKGCGDMLSSSVNCVYLEVGYEREITKVHFSDVESFMETQGFQLCGIYETRRNLFNKHKLWYSNNLYIKKHLLY